MKRKILAKLSIVAAVFCMATAALAGCSTQPREYTIQYSDDAGTHTITVTGGKPYSLESVPYRYGYEFLGLFDALTGGVQYVDANGASLTPYEERGSKVLFPQFKPIDYTVVLNYGEAEVTGPRSLTVAYDSAIPELPTDLTLAHNDFTGWYTEENAKGVQVADAVSNLPDTSILNEKNFKLDDSKRVYLYAGFKLKTYAVTFHFDGMPDETIEVAYNTPIGNVVPTTRNAQKQAVLVWSTMENDTEREAIYNGRITEAIDLYAVEWAPVIELDGNGADVTPVVARAGDTVALPTPEKPLAKFLYWADTNGQRSELTKMPEEGATLHAVWQGKIEFDENGGTEVKDVSEPAGESITLPTPEKDGYLFAGWYTAEKDAYTQTKMPAAGIALKAGWYKEKTATEILVKDSNDEDDWAHTAWTNKEISGPVSDWRKKIDLSKYGDVVNRVISITIHCDMKSHCSSFVWEGGFYLYDGAVVSDANYLTKATATVSSDSWKSFTFQKTFVMRDEILYLCYYARKTTTVGMGYCELFYKNYYIEINYPDTTYLYL